MLDTEWFEDVSEPDWPESWDDVGCKSWRFAGEGYAILVHDNHSSLKSITARLKLEEIASEMNEGWKPDWSSPSIKKYMISSQEVALKVNWCWAEKRHIAFKTKEMAEFSLKHHRQLWLDYWQIDE